MLITEERVRQFAAVSGDNNPIHLNRKYAEKSIFKERIAHGFLVGSTISAKIAKLYTGAIYISQKMKFRKPVYINDSVTASITELQKDGNRVLLDTRVLNQHGDIVISGEALILHETE